MLQGMHSIGVAQKQDELRKLQMLWKLVNAAEAMSAAEVTME